MTLRNLRAYTQDADDTLTSVNASDYETGKGANARLRKINLNVDLATQAELNEAFNLLSNAIEDISTGTLSNYYTKPEANEISTALSNAAAADIEAEATTREEADNAIKASLSAYALRTTVADAYKVTVVKDETPETSAYVATYHVEQNGTQVGASINIPKDYVVKDAALCTVTEAGVPYPEAQVDDKYIDFTVNTAESDDVKHIYLPVKDLVDVYTGGSTTFADVNVDNNRVITVNVSADTISAAAVAAVVGTSEDLSTANTIYGTKKYVDAQVTGKNVDAQGDTYITASASNNKVTVGATNDLTAAVAAANSALQSISKGTDGTYVTTTIGTKDSNNNQTVGVAVTVAALTAGTNGLAEATDVKQYVNGKITDLSVSAAGDAYVNATSTGKAITVTATDKLTAVVDKVEQTSATWDAAAPLTALEAEQTARANADTALSTAIDALSSTYASKTTVDSAATTLEAATALTAKALTAYNDIDEIIQELEDLKAAVKTFADSLKTA